MSDWMGRHHAVKWPYLMWGTLGTLSLALYVFGGHRWYNLVGTLIAYFYTIALYSYVKTRED